MSDIYAWNDEAQKWEVVGLTARVGRIVYGFLDPVRAPPTPRDWDVSETQSGWVIVREVPLRR